MTTPRVRLSLRWSTRAALEQYEETAEAGYFAASGGDDAILWHPSYAPVRKTDRYKAFGRKSGYVEYWRAKGWPDLCRPWAPTISPVIEAHSLQQKVAMSFHAHYWSFMAQKGS
jgi:hypothetical protein